MFRFRADHNFNEHIVRGLIRQTGADVVLARDVGLDEVKDPNLLEWASVEGRVLLTHDRETMIAFVNERVRQGRRTPGVIVVGDRSGTGRAVNDLALFAACATEEDCRDQVVYLPWSS